MKYQNLFYVIVQCKLFAIILHNNTITNLSSYNTFLFMYTYFTSILSITYYKSEKINVIILNGYYLLYTGIVTRSRQIYWAI